MELLIFSYENRPVPSERRFLNIVPIFEATRYIKYSRKCKPANNNNQEARLSDKRERREVEVCRQIAAVVDLEERTVRKSFYFNMLLSYWTHQCLFVTFFPIINFKGKLNLHLSVIFNLKPTYSLCKINYLYPLSASVVRLYKTAN